MINGGPKQVPVRLWLHRDTVTASPDGATPIDCICFVVGGYVHTRVDLVWINPTAFAWLEANDYLRTRRKERTWTPVNEVLRAALEAMRGKPVAPIPFSTFDSMPSKDGTP